MFIRNLKGQKYYIILTSSIKRNYIEHINNCDVTVMQLKIRYNDEQRRNVILTLFLYVIQTNHKKRNPSVIKNRLL